MSKIIEIQDLKKTFVMGKTTNEVLKGINLSIDKGEFISIMGQSGSGKSTLLYLMGALDRPTSGTIKINGKDISKLSDKECSIFHRREVGFVFQFYNLVPNLNVEDNILLPVLLDHRKAKDYEDRLEELLEPVGNLDSKAGIKVMELLRDINKKYNKTIVQVTHSPEHATYGTRLIHIKDGIVDEHREEKSVIRTRQ